MGSEFAMSTATVKAGLVFAVLGVFLICPGGDIRAETGISHIVELHTGQTLLSAYGLVIIEGEAREVSEMDPLRIMRPRVRIREAELVRRARNLWEARVQLQPEDLVEGAKVTAVARTDKEGVVAGAVRWIVSPPVLRPPEGALKCSAAEEFKQSLSLLRELDRSSLEELIQVRAKRSEILRRLIGNALGDHIFSIANKREQDLGLRHDAPLSRDTPVEELAVRLGVLRSLGAAPTAY